MQASSELVLSWKTARLTRADVALLEPRQWLNDSCITFYLEYLASQNGEVASRVLALGAETSFWLMNEEDFEDLEDAAAGLELKEKDLIICPLNDNSDVEAAGGGTHWSLLVARVISSHKMSFEYFDSVNTTNLDASRRLAAKLAALRLGPEVAGPTAAEVSVVACAKQDNASDCGVYTLLFAAAALEGYVREGPERGAQACAGVVTTFSPQDAAAKRLEILAVIKAEAAKAADAR